MTPSSGPRSKAIALAARNALADALEAVAGQARDWAFWDDAYDYAAKPDPEFIKKNITASTFDDLNIDLIGLFDRDGRLLFGQSGNPDSGRPGPLPEELLSRCVVGSPFLRSPATRRRGPASSACPTGRCSSPPPRSSARTRRDPPAAR